MERGKKLNGGFQIKVSEFTGRQDPRDLIDGSWIDRQSIDYQLKYGPSMGSIDLYIRPISVDF